MKEHIYYPYKAYKFFLPLNIMAFLVFGFCLVSSLTAEQPLNANSLLFTLLFILNIALFVYMLRESRKTVILSDEGVSLCIKDKVIYQKAWNELRYAYLKPNAKGHELMVLSAEPLSKDEVGKIIRKADIKFHSVVEDRLVIATDGSEDIRKILRSKLVTTQFPGIL